MAQQYEFKAKYLPYLLVLPQMLIVFVFFFWPSFQGVWQSFFLQDPFGGRVIFVGLENYTRLFTDPASSYGESFRVSVAFAVCVAALSMIIALFLATQANKKIKFSSFYKTMMIWPYAVATMVAGVLWLFMFNPNVGVIAWFLKHRLGIEWQHLLNSGQAFLLVTMAASWKQISYNFVFFLAGLQSVPVDLVEAAAIDGDYIPVVIPDHVLSARDEPGLRFLRDVPYHPSGNRGRSGEVYEHPGIQGLARRGDQSRSRRVVGSIGHTDDHGYWPDRRTVPLYRAARALLRSDR